MLITIKELKEDEKFKDFSDNKLKRKLNAIENTIREYTNNNFQNRLVRLEAISKDNKLIGYNPYLRPGDTIEISESINNGLYTIKSIENGKIALEEDIYDSEHNFCTKVEYPTDIIEGAIDLLDWTLNKADKIGIASESETISRHSTSTTYKALDQNNTINGYPAELFGFCKPYIKARF